MSRRFEALGPMTSSSDRRTFGGFALALLLFVAACGGGRAVAPVATERPVPTLDVQALSVSLPPPVLGDPSTPMVQSKVEGALVAVGYKVVSGSAPSDIQVVVSTRTEFEPSAFQVSVNGQSGGTDHVQVQISLFAHATLVDRVSGEFVATQGSVDDAVIVSLADAITRSRRLKEYAEQVMAKRSAQASAADEAQKQAADDAQRRAADAQQRSDDASQRAAQQQARREEDATWYRIRVEECRVPRSAQSCDIVRAFLAKYPDGAHATEAKAALDAAAPKLEAIQKDEAAWAAAEPDACRRHDKDGCAKVEIYLVKFPAGNHAAEARALTGGTP